MLLSVTHVPIFVSLKAFHYVMGVLTSTYRQSSSTLNMSANAVYKVSCNFANKFTDARSEGTGWIIRCLSYMNLKASKEAYQVLASLRKRHCGSLTLIPIALDTNKSAPPARSSPRWDAHCGPHCTAIDITDSENGVDDTRKTLTSNHPSCKGIAV